VGAACLETIDCRQRELFRLFSQAGFGLATAPTAYAGRARRRAPDGSAPPADRGRRAAYLCQFGNPIDRAHIGRAKLKAKLRSPNLDDWRIPPKPPKMRWATSPSLCLLRHCHRCPCGFDWQGARAAFLCDVTCLFPLTGIRKKGR